MNDIFSQLGTAVSSGITNFATGAASAATSAGQNLVDQILPKQTGATPTSTPVPAIYQPPTMPNWVWPVVGVAGLLLVVLIVVRSRK